MFDMSGHRITVRAPQPPFADRENPSQSFPGDVEPYDLKREDVAFVVVGEDLGECLLLAVGHDGRVLFEETDEPREVLDLYHVGAVTLNKALEVSQKAAAA